MKLLFLENIGHWTIGGLLFSRTRLQLLFQQSVDSRISLDFQMNDIIKIVLSGGIITIQRRCFGVVLHTTIKGLVISIILKRQNRKSITKNKSASSMRMKLKQSVVRPLINR